VADQTQVSALLVFCRRPSAGANDLAVSVLSPTAESELHALVDNATEHCPGGQAIRGNVTMQAMAKSTRERERGRIGAMSDPRTAPYGAVRLADVDTLDQVDPGNPDINDCAFHLVRRHFDVQAFGVNAATGNAGDEMIEAHHEADDEENQTNGHEELFAVMTGHAVFTVDGEEIDAPAGTIVFVRDPTLLRQARATADDTAIFMVGGPVGIPYTVSRWEVALP
jgi:mannose-6-phosphate isomerase-like protein (cupin superfamily)